jgi:serine/threonine protein kinase
MEILSASQQQPRQHNVRKLPSPSLHASVPTPEDSSTSVPKSVQVGKQGRRSVLSRSRPGHSDSSSVSSQSDDNKHNRPYDGGGLQLPVAQNIPAFHIDEIIRGERLVCNKSCEVYEIRGVRQSHEQDEPTLQLPRDHLANQINSKKYRRDTSGTPLAKRFVLKHIRRERMDSQLKFEEAASELENEATMMKGLNHPNIAKLRGISIGGTEAYYLTGNHDSFFIIVEQMEETLARKIVRWRSKENFHRFRTVFGLFPRRRAEQKFLIERLHVIFDISNGLQYIHGHGICHRNLHISSIGFNAQNNVQIMEFGKACQNSRTVERANERSDPSVAAPSILHYDDSGVFPINTRSSPPKASGFQKDVLDFSRIVCEVLTMRSVNNSMSDRQGKAYIRSFRDLASFIPRRLLGMLQRGLSDFPDSRPTISEFRDCLNDVLLGLVKEHKESSGTSGGSSTDPYMSIGRSERRLTELGLLGEGEEVPETTRDATGETKDGEAQVNEAENTESMRTSFTGGCQVL